MTTGKKIFVTSSWSCGKYASEIILFFPQNAPSSKMRKNMIMRCRVMSNVCNYNLIFRECVQSDAIVKEGTKRCDTISDMVYGTCQ